MGFFDAFKAMDTTTEQPSRFGRLATAYWRESLRLIYHFFGLFRIAICAAVKAASLMISRNSWREMQTMSFIVSPQ